MHAQLVRDGVALDRFAAATRRSLLALLVVGCTVAAWPAGRPHSSHISSAHGSNQDQQHQQHQQHFELLQHPADRSVGIRAFQCPSRLPAVERASLLYCYGSS
jgi:hypothetical protein